MTRRFSSRSFAGIVRTDVAVGTASDASMFLTIAAAAPLSGVRVVGRLGHAAWLAPRFGRPFWLGPAAVLGRRLGCVFAAADAPSAVSPARLPAACSPRRTRASSRTPTTGPAGTGGTCRRRASRSGRSSDRSRLHYGACAESAFAQVINRRPVRIDQTAWSARARQARTRGDSTPSPGRTGAGCSSGGVHMPATTRIIAAAEARVQHASRTSSSLSSSRASSPPPAAPRSPRARPATRSPTRRSTSSAATRTRSSTRSPTRSSTSS